MGYFRENVEKAAGYVPGFQPKAAEVVKLNTNENPYPPSERVVEAVRNFDVEKLRRYPQPLGDDFRQAVSRVLGVRAVDIICSNGGDDLLTMCFRAFCDSGRAAVYPVPTYSLYPVLAKIQDCPVVEIGFDSDGLIEKLIAAKGALTILCRPNAPTGASLPLEKVRQLAAGLSGVLLIDEAYADFASDNCIGLVKEFDNVLILRSMSKGYSLAGLRFGYGVGNEKLIKGLLKVKDSYNVDAVAISAATAAIKDQEYFKACVEKVKSEREVLTGELRKLGFSVGDSESNFLLATANGFDAGAVYKELVGRNIYVRYWDVPELKDKLRITVGTKEENAKLLAAIKEIVG